MRQSGSAFVMLNKVATHTAEWSSQVGIVYLLAT